MNSLQDANQTLAQLNEESMDVNFTTQWLINVSMKSLPQKLSNFFASLTSQMR